MDSRYIIREVACSHDGGMPESMSLRVGGHDFDMVPTRTRIDVAPSEVPKYSLAVQREVQEILRSSGKADDFLNVATSSKAQWELEIIGARMAEHLLSPQARDVLATQRSIGSHKGDTIRVFNIGSEHYEVLPWELCYIASPGDSGFFLGEQYIVRRITMWADAVERWHKTIADARPVWRRDGPVPVVVHPAFANHYRESMVTSGVQAKFPARAVVSVGDLKDFLSAAANKGLCMLVCHGKEPAAPKDRKPGQLRDKDIPRALRGCKDELCVTSGVLLNTEPQLDIAVKDLARLQIGPRTFLTIVACETTLGLFPHNLVASSGASVLGAWLSIPEHLGCAIAARWASALARIIDADDSVHQLAVHHELLRAIGPSACLFRASGNFTPMTIE